MEFRPRKWISGEMEVEVDKTQEIQKRIYPASPLVGKELAWKRLFQLCFPEKKEAPNPCRRWEISSSRREDPLLCLKLCVLLTELISGKIISPNYELCYYIRSVNLYNCNLKVFLKLLHLKETNIFFYFVSSTLFNLLSITVTKPQRCLPKPLLRVSRLSMKRVSREKKWDWKLLSIL